MEELRNDEGFGTLDAKIAAGLLNILHGEFARLVEQEEEKEADIHDVYRNHDANNQKMNASQTKNDRQDKQNNIIKQTAHKNHKKHTTPSKHTKQHTMIRSM